MSRDCAEELDRLVTDFATERKCPTIAWGVVIDGEPALTGSVGDVSERTVYRIASMTKSFSAAATLLLRDEGVLRLDDPVTAHATELRVLDRTDSAPVTIRDLLSMTSGLPTDDPWADRHLDLTDEEFDRIIGDGPLFAHPTGNTFEYSNFGFAVLGRVVHRATGRRIQEIVSDRLLAPLDMHSTTWTKPDHDDWARPKRWLDDAYVDEREPLPDGLIAPMGGLWTTVADLATWVSWLDDAFPARDERDDGPLTRASRREMQTPQQYIGRRSLRGVEMPQSYGYGLGVLDDPGLGTVVAHAGGLPGYGSNMRWLSGRRTGVIALANSTYAPMTELSALMLDIVAEQGLASEARSPVPTPVASVAERLVALLNEWDDHAAASLFTTSLVLDDPLERRQSAAEQLVATVGHLSIASIEASTNARATVRCTAAGGDSVTVSFLLAPPAPPRIQSYSATVEPADDTAG